VRPADPSGGRGAAVAAVLPAGPWRVGSACPFEGVLEQVDPPSEAELPVRHGDPLAQGQPSRTVCLVSTVTLTGFQERSGTATYSAAP
jgi:hypothetical protein